MVCDGQIIGRGYNLRETRCTVTAHAEMVALDDACRHLGRWRLPDCALVVTLEPCPMCAGAILAARVGTLIYGARDEKRGAVHSKLCLFEELQDPGPAVYSGVLAEESLSLLRAFFALRRNPTP